MSIPTLSYGSRGSLRIDLDVLVRSRMLIQCNSGGGKSWALRQLLEETYGRVQQLILDDEGEFGTLRESFDYVYAAKHGGDVEASPRTARMLCRRLMETSASAVIDLYDHQVPQRRELVKLFLTELMALPKDLRRPLLVVLDEAHKYAPEGGKSEALEAVMTVASQGRKRGYALVCATQRLSKLSKDVAAELLTRMIGRTGLDLDVKRAGDELGMDKEGRSTLPMIEPGTFYVFGPAVVPAGPPRVVRTGAVKTTHPEPGAVSPPTPPPSAKVKALLTKSLADLPQQAAEEARSVAELQKVNTELARKLKHAEKSAIEKIVEKKVVDQGSIDAAVRTAVRNIQEKQKAALATLRKEGRSLARVAAVLESGVRDLEPIAQAILAVPDQLSGTAVDDPATRTLTGPPISKLPSSATMVDRPVRRVEPRTMAADDSSNGAVPRPQQRILDTIAQFETLGIEKPTRSNIGAFLGVSASTGSFKNYLGALRSSGYISYPTEGQVALTDEGRAIANPSSGPQSREDLHDTWLGKLPAPQARILKLVLWAYPEPISREAIAEQLRVSHDTGSFKNYLGAIRSLGLIDYPSDGMVVATDLLFPKGL